MDRDCAIIAVIVKYFDCIRIIDKDYLVVAIFLKNVRRRTCSFKHYFVTHFRVFIVVETEVHDPDVSSFVGAPKDIGRPNLDKLVRKDIIIRNINVKRVKESADNYLLVGLNAESRFKTAIITCDFNNA